VARTPRRRHSGANRHDGLTTPVWIPRSRAAYCLRQSTHCAKRPRCHGSLVYRHVGCTTPLMTVHKDQTTTSSVASTPRKRASTARVKRRTSDASNKPRTRKSTAKARRRSTRGGTSPKQKTSSQRKVTKPPSPKKRSRYDVDSQRAVGRSLHEMKRGALRSGGSGKKVTDPKQAIAIGLSEARRKGAKVPLRPGERARPK
jgi:hypothetical protein